MLRAVAVCHPRAQAQPTGLTVVNGAPALAAPGRRWDLDAVYAGAHAAAELHDDYVDNLVQGLLDGHGASIVGVGRRPATRAAAGSAEPVLDALGLLPRATELTLARLQQHGAEAGWLTKLRVGCFAITDGEAIMDLLNPDHEPLALRGRPGPQLGFRGHRTAVAGGAVVSGPRAAAWHQLAGLPRSALMPS